MEDSILKILLTSSVIANLVTSTFNLAKGFQKDKIDNVVNERKGWREKIREIAVKIEGACKCNIKNVLSELKVRLNAYGMKSNSDYEKDGHIWGIIRKMENTDYNQKEYSGDFEVDKKLLVEYLSLLLKYDWERSKNEVFGNIKIYAFDVIFWIGFVVLLFMYSLNKMYGCLFLFLIIYLNYICFEDKLEKIRKDKLGIGKGILMGIVILIGVGILRVIGIEVISILKEISTLKDTLIVALKNILIGIDILMEILMFKEIVIDNQVLTNVLVYSIVLLIFGFIRIKEKIKRIENENNYKLSVEELENKYNKYKLKNKNVVKD